jgi:hypothetical protein
VDERAMDKMTMSDPHIDTNPRARSTRIARQGAEKYHGDDDQNRKTNGFFHISFLKHGLAAPGLSERKPRTITRGF